MKYIQNILALKLTNDNTNSALKWEDHAAAVKSKAAKRLWFLKKRKRAAMFQLDSVISAGVMQRF